MTTSLSHSENSPRYRERRRGIVRHREAMRNPRCPSDEAQGSYCLRAEGPRTEHPFRPIDEALYPYRAGNRCALNSLDTDRSTTLSPETVTANCVSAAKWPNISARPTFFAIEIFARNYFRRSCALQSGRGRCSPIQRYRSIGKNRLRRFFRDLHGCRRRLFVLGESRAAIPRRGFCRLHWRVATPGLLGAFVRFR